MLGSGCSTAPVAGWMDFVDKRKLRKQDRRGERQPPAGDYRYGDFADDYYPDDILPPEPRFPTRPTGRDVIDLPAPAPSDRPVSRVPPSDERIFD